MLLYGVAAVLLIAILVVVFLAYFVTSFDRVTGAWKDGLGRTLVPAPYIAQLVFGVDRAWPGWGWFGVDLVVFWGTIASAFWIGGLASRLDHEG